MSNHVFFFGKWLIHCIFIKMGKVENKKENKLRLTLLDFQSPILLPVWHLFFETAFYWLFFPFFFGEEVGKYINIFPSLSTNISPLVTMSVMSCIKPNLLLLHNFYGHKIWREIFHCSLPNCYTLKPSIVQPLPTFVWKLLMEINDRRTLISLAFDIHLLIKLQN